MSRHNLGVSFGLVLALSTVGCGSRKPASKEVTLTPDTAEEAAQFDARSDGQSAVFSGNLPLGEVQPEMGRFLEPSGFDEESMGGSGRGRGAQGAGLTPEELALFADVRFEFDSYALTSTAKEQLLGLGAYLRANDDLDVLVEGHCDERGDAAYNLALGEKRALTVREFLAGTRVQPTRVVTVSFGEERPLDPGSDEAALARNRRARFRVRRR